MKSIKTIIAATLFSVSLGISSSAFAQSEEVDYGIAMDYRNSPVFKWFLVGFGAVTVVTVAILVKKNNEVVIREERFNERGFVPFAQS